jgi:arginine/ornithine transport system permease protein
VSVPDRSRDLIAENQQAFLRGIGLTLELLALSVAIALLLAVPLALMRLKLAQIVAAGSPMAMSICFRGTPLLTQLFLIYYGLAQFDWSAIRPLWPILRDPGPAR